MTIATSRRLFMFNSQLQIPTWLAIALVCTFFLACNRSAQEREAKSGPNPSAAAHADASAESAPLPDADAPQVPDTDDPFWDGLARDSIQLGQTLLVVKGSKGLAGCTYLNVDTFERTGEPCVILPAADFDGMLDAKVTAATSQAKSLGIKVGMPGRQALELLR